MLVVPHLTDRTPTKVLNGKTPYEKLFKAKPCSEHIRVFGLCIQ